MNIRNRILSALALVALFGLALAALVVGSHVESASAAGPHVSSVSSESSVSANYEATVIAAGLNNPRGLNFDSEGALYVAEAGRGGAGPDRKSTRLNSSHAITSRMPSSA